MTSRAPRPDTGTPPSVRVLVEADLEPATEVIVHAFRRDPAATYLVPDARARDAAMAPFFALNVLTAIQTGLALGVGEAGRLDGVLLAVRPGEVVDPDPEPTPDQSRPESSTAVPGFADRLAPFFEAMHGLTEAGLARSHWRLDFLATEPAAQGRGVASALVASFHATADPDGVPTGLLTFVAANVGFYERRGYRVTATRDFAPGGFSMWAMMRGATGGSAR